MTEALEEYLRSRRAAIETALQRFLPRGADCPPIVCDAMSYSLFAGGKRFRPVLTLAAAEAVAAHPEVAAAHPNRPSDTLLALALPAACALEMIHTYSLIHDDLPAMDNDTMRRGRPTLHVVYGEGMAILGGDALLTEAFALLAREPAGGTPDLQARKLRVIETIASAAGVAGMVGGQALDLEATGSHQPASPPVPPTLSSEGGQPQSGEGRAGNGDVAALERMHACKTGALIRAAAVAGAVMAGGGDPLVAAVDGYATELGLAFQIVDDILDVEGSAADLGKSVGKDAAAGKLTFPALLGLDASRTRARDCAERAHAIVRSAGLQHGRLDDIVEWVVGRTK